MPNSIKVDGGFTIDTLLRYAEIHGGNIKGQMTNGMLEVYSSKHGAGFLPMRSMRKQGLANEALHAALTNSFSEKVADAVFRKMDAELYRDGGYLTHDLIAKADQKARSIAAQQAHTARRGRPKTMNIDRDLGAGWSDAPGSDEKGKGKSDLSRRKGPGVGAYLPPPLLGTAEDDDPLAAFKKVGGRGRAMSDSSGVSDLFAPADDVSDVSDLFAPLPEPGDDPNRNAISHTPRPVPPFERPEPPTTGFKQKLDGLTAISDTSRSDRLRRLEARSAEDRGRINRTAGLRLLQTHGIGALLMAAREPDGNDRLGSAHGFAAESARPDFQGPSRAKAEEAILRAFERYDKGSIASMSDSERWDLAVDALEDYLALRPNVDR